MGRFIKLKCDGCKNEQIIFDRASTTVKCLICGKELAQPQGGKAKVSSPAEVLQ